MPQVTFITAYEYDELSDEAKQTALQWYRESDIDGHDRVQQVTFELTDILTRLGYPTDPLEWSLGHCQGDGVAFYGTLCLESFLEAQIRRQTNPFPKEIPVYADSPDFKRTMERALCNYHKVVEDHGLRVKIVRNSYGYHYSHENTMKLDVEDCFYMEEPHPKLMAMWDRLFEWIGEDIRKVSKALADIGYDTLDWLSGEEYVADTLRANGYLFTEDGRRSIVLN